MEAQISFFGQTGGVRVKGVGLHNSPPLYCTGCGGADLFLRPDKGNRVKGLGTVNFPPCIVQAVEAQISFFGQTGGVGLRA